ncbi:MAG: FliM/FliN family flagellar motor switch protein [Gammaproteobacteria bacterium]|nr:FliM/FliN family flagellar motor switch protein [Gammaproteobacteria bacterium]MDH5800658.1 FliM/FliN family flagellar motor switch protein [Gammaproteobacteria bacterium]
MAVESIELAELKKEKLNGKKVVDNHLDLIKNVKVKLEVFVGDTELSVGELMDLKENQTIALNTDVSAPLDIVLDGKVVARGALAAVGDNFGIRITEIMDTV